MTDLNGHRLELVDIPEKHLGKDWWLHGNGRMLVVDNFDNYIPLHPGDYELLGRGDLISEEQWEKLVGNKLNGKYLEYVSPGMMRVNSLNHAYSLNTAKESGESWIRSQGKEPSKTILLLIK